MRIASTTVGIGLAPVYGTRLTLPQENDAVTPTLAFADGDSGIYESTDDTLNFTTAGSERFRMVGNLFRGQGANSGGIYNEVSSATNPTLAPNHNDANTGIGRAAADQLSLIAGGTEISRLTSSGLLIPDGSTLALELGTGADSRLYYDGTDTFLDLRAVGTGDLMIALAGSFPSPDANNVHIWKGDSGASTGSDTSGLLIENSAGTGLDIMVPDGSNAAIIFRTPTTARHGNITYAAAATPEMRFNIANSNRLIYSAAAFAFQEATTISTTAGALTLTPTTDTILSNGTGLIVGHTTQRVATETGITAEAQIIGTTDNDGTLLLFVGSGSNTVNPNVIFAKAADNSLDGVALVADGEDIGEIIWVGGDGTDLATQVAAISVQVDGTPAASDIPGRIRFLTSAGATGLQERIRIDSSGFVGIGDTTPQHLLTIGSSAASTTLAIDNTASDGDSMIQFQLSGVTAWYMGVNDSASDTFRITDTALSSLTDQTGLTIEAGGNVGIGTTDPTDELTFGGSATISTTNSGALTLQPTGLLQITSNMRVFDDIAMQFGSGNDYLWRYDNTNTRLELVTTDSDSSGTDADLIRIEDGTDDILLVPVSGNVGINDTTPQHILTVGSSAASTTLAIDNTAADGDSMLQFQLSGVTEWFMGVDDSQSDVFRITDTALSSLTDQTGLTIEAGGNVGIGTTDPGRELQVESTSPQLMFRDSDALIDERRWEIDASGGKFVIRSSNDGLTGTESAIVIAKQSNNTDVDYIAFNTDNSDERMRITNGGNIGWGDVDST